ncbi:MAG: FAD-dependent oxidoreductase [Actinomycetota bacterium]|nr:FAD-dependent oxidoreductase [Actinomycetota bacterium]
MFRRIEGGAMSMGAQGASAQVVIVGAGPSGLATAIELGRRGVTCLVLEREPRAGHAPRAKTTHTRTREHLRRWGIADDLAAAAPFGVDYPSHVLFVSSLGGELIVRFDHALNCSPERDDRYSEHSQWIPQYKLEAVMRAYAASLDCVRIEFGQEFVSMQQDAGSVSSVVRDLDSGIERRVHSDFVVGADGAGSVVRTQIGAQMVGTYGLSYNYNTIFRAPGLAEAHPHGPGIMYWQLNPEAPSLIGPMDQPDLWYFMPTGIEPGRTFTDADSCELIRRSTRIDLPYEIVSSDQWVASRLIADRYRLGRAFLVGDACHLHPPFGGFGMNMGVADGVDLGWKVAAVLHGWGGDTLLESYERERRPAHEYVMDEAEANHALNPSKLFRPGMHEPTEEGQAIRREVAAVITEFKKNEFYALGVVLGYCYQDSPVIWDDGTGAEWKRSREYAPSATPGCLAPHRWLGEATSLYDQFGEGFTLLVLAGNRNAATAARAEADRTGTPLTIVCPDDASLADLYGADLALIRPDQHVAWRGDQWPDRNVLLHATGRRPTG